MVCESMGAKVLNPKSAKAEGLAATDVTKPQTKPIQEGCTGLAALIGEAATDVTKPQTKPIQEGYTGLAALISEAATDSSSLAFVRQMVPSNTKLNCLVLQMVKKFARFRWANGREAQPSNSKLDYLVTVN